MRHFFRFLKEHANRFLVGLLFVLGIGVILLLLPAERKYRYEFQKGKPWQHEDLYAPFDFAIIKTDNEIVKEKDSLLKNFIPYYKLDNEIFALQKEKYITAFYAHVDTRYKDREIEVGDTAIPEFHIFMKGLQILEHIYEKGILSEDREKIGAFINLLNDKTLTEHSTEQFFTLTEAKVFLVEELNNYATATADTSVYLLQKKVPLRGFLKPDIFYDKEYSEQQKQNIISSISAARGMVQEDEKIISKGDLVDENSYRVLYSLKREYEASNINTREMYFIYLGQTILVLFAFFILILLIYYAQPDILATNKSSLFIILIVVLFVALASMVARIEQVNIYIVPFVMIPILIKTFFNQRIALFTHVVTMLIVAFMAPNSFEFVFIQIIVGVIAMFSIGDNYKRSYLFWTTVIVFCSYSIVYLGIGIKQEGDVMALNWHQFMWFAWSSLLLLTLYPLIFVFEKLFGYISDLTLIELSDTNNALLRDLSEKAPGTFQHSLMVSNLAEYVAGKIGAKPLLAKVGALYHDIGKAANPSYFTENQQHIENPHNKLKPEESTKIIINHVLDGAKIAKKAKLPSQIIDFIMTHHGTTKVKYFLYQYKQAHPGEEIDEEQFEYPAYKPYTKELACMMIADSLEAASRSLKEYNDETISGLVNSTIDRVIDDRQLDEVDITFKDLTQLRKAFIDKLTNIYHSRIAYPEEALKK